MPTSASNIFIMRGIGRRKTFGSSIIYASSERAFHAFGGHCDAIFNWVKLRGLPNLDWLFLLTAAAFNLWRIPKLVKT